MDLSHLDHSELQVMYLECLKQLTQSHELLKQSKKLNKFYKNKIATMIKGQQIAQI